jgi:hypothetical protein
MKIKLVEKESSAVINIEEATEFTPGLAVIDCGKAGHVKKLAQDGTEWQTATEREVSNYAEAHGVTFGSV